jgi:hypothetical protein
MELKGQLQPQLTSVRFTSVLCNQGLITHHSINWRNTMNAKTLSKAELIAIVEASQPKPHLPVHIKAHEVGANVRQHIIDSTAAVKKGAVVTGSVTKGFFQGLFGK